MKKWVSLAAMLGMMALIFFLSAQPGESSGALSESVADSMQHSGAADLLLPAWFSANVYANVRKWAHVYIYAALGAAAGVTASFWLPDWTRSRQAGLAAAVCFAFAASDECHQFFVPGRAVLFSDIGVDALGFVPGILAALLVLCLLQRRRKNQ